MLRASVWGPWPSVPMGRSSKLQERPCLVASRRTWPAAGTLLLPGGPSLRRGQYSSKPRPQGVLVASANRGDARGALAGAAALDSDVQRQETDPGNSLEGLCREPREDQLSLLHPSLRGICSHSSLRAMTALVQTFIVFSPGLSQYFPTGLPAFVLVPLLPLTYFFQLHT